MKMTKDIEVFLKSEGFTLVLNTGWIEQTFPVNWIMLNLSILLS